MAFLRTSEYIIEHLHRPDGSYGAEFFDYESKVDLWITAGGRDTHVKLTLDQARELAEALLDPRKGE